LSNLGLHPSLLGISTVGLIVSPCLKCRSLTRPRQTAHPNV